VTNVGNGTNAMEVALPAVGLLAGTNYHYRVVATNWGNYGSLTLGGDMVFATERVVLPPEPRIAWCAMQEDRCFHLEFAGEPGVTYTVLVSTNLAEWRAVDVATENAPGHFHFTDPQAPSHTTRYYRLRCP